MKATIIYRAQTHEYDIEQPTVAALKHAIQQNLNLPLETQKLLAKGKQLKDDDIVPQGKIMVIASSADSIAAVKEQTQRLAESARRGPPLQFPERVSIEQRNSPRYIASTPLKRYLTCMNLSGLSRTLSGWRMIGLSSG